MSFSSDVIATISDTIATYGSVGTVSIVDAGANPYDDDGNELNNSTDLSVDYVSKNLTEKERVRFSNYNEMKRITIVHLATDSIKKGDVFTDSSGIYFTIEEVDTLGDTQGSKVIRELYCLIA